MKRLRMTVLHEFDYHGELTTEAVDRLSQNFLRDPTAFLHPDELEWDEVLIVEFYDISEENDGA